MAKVSRIQLWLYPELRRAPDVLSRAEVRRLEWRPLRSVRFWAVTVGAEAVAPLIAGILAKLFIPRQWLAPIGVKPSAAAYLFIACGGVFIALWYGRRMTRHLIAAELAAARAHTTTHADVSAADDPRFSIQQ